MRIIPLLSILSCISVALVGQEWEGVREKAESHFEIAKLLVKQKKYDELIRECQKLYGLPTPPEHESHHVTSASWLADRLTDDNKPSVAAQVLDLAIKALGKNKNKAALIKEKAYIYKKMGKDEEAMRLFQEAIRLGESDNN